MTDAVLAAVGALCQLLEAENAALEILDLPAATAFVSGKQAALAALVDAQERCPALPGDALRLPTARLVELARANGKLLERAMAAQSRVLAIIADAVPRATAGPARYGPHGQETRLSAQAPVALLSRA
jgi:hypothetical protein